MKGLKLEDLLKINRVEATIRKEDLEYLKKYTNMTEEQLLCAAIVLVKKLNDLTDKQEELIKQQVEKEKLQERVIDGMASDLNVLKEDRNASENKLRLERQKKIKYAYKEDASVDKVVALKNKGLSNKEIAEQLDISTVTVWSRLKEAKKAHNK